MSDSTPSWIRKIFRNSPKSRAAEPANMRLDTLEDRVVPAPIPTLTGLAAPGSVRPLLGDNASYSFTFTNTSGADTGYGPFVEVAVDTTGRDGDGIDAATNDPAQVDDGFGDPVVTSSGVPLNQAGAIILKAGQTTFVNPLTLETRNVPAGFGEGDTIFIYALPFGSFTPGQSSAMTITAPISKLADVGTAIPISVTAGFRDDTPATEWTRHLHGRCPDRCDSRPVSDQENLPRTRR